MKPPAFTLIALLLAAVPAQPQQAGNDATFSARSSLVYLPTRIQTKTGETIYGLKPDQFIVEDNGARQTVSVDEDPGASGLSLVVAVQCGRSASTEFSKLSGLGAMIDGIVGSAPHEVAVISYGERPYLLADLSGSSAAWRLGLSKLRPCGSFGAASIDAAYYALNMLNRRRNRYRHAVILIGETRDHGSGSGLHDVVAELGVTDTVIYSVAFSALRGEVSSSFRANNVPIRKAPAPPPEPLEPADKPQAPPAKDPIYAEHAPLLELPPQLTLFVNALRQNASAALASLSGGEHMTFSTQRNLEEDLLEISNQIHNYYLLSFTPSSAPMSLHSLRVIVPDHPGAVIQTRRNYWQ